MVATVKITWPKDLNGETFSIDKWIMTLSYDDQQEWHSAISIHDKMIADAVAASDAIKTNNTVEWKSVDIWQSYILKYLTEDVMEVESRYWNKYLATVNLTKDDVIQMIDD